MHPVPYLTQPVVITKQQCKYFSFHTYVLSTALNIIDKKIHKPKEKKRKKEK